MPQTRSRVATEALVSSRSSRLMNPFESPAPPPARRWSSRAPSGPRAASRRYGAREDPRNRARARPWRVSESTGVGVARPPRRALQGRPSRGPNGLPTEAAGRALLQAVRSRSERPASSTRPPGETTRPQRRRGNEACARRCDLAVLLATPALAATHETRTMRRPARHPAGDADVHERAVGSSIRAHAGVHLRSVDASAVPACRGRGVFLHVRLRFARGPGDGLRGGLARSRGRAGLRVFNVRTDRRVADGVAAKYRRSAFCSLRSDSSTRHTRCVGTCGSFWEFIDDAAPDRGWF